MKAIEPVWATKPETASRVRGRIERILDWAKVRGFRDGDNPARWRGHLDHLLPARGKIGRVKHHAALPYAELPAFMVQLKMRDAVAARAGVRNFDSSTNQRSVRCKMVGDRFGCSCLDNSGGTNEGGTGASRPARRPRHPDHRKHEGFKAERLHFYGDRRANLSNMSLLMLLRRMGRNDITSHGFRSTFRDWVAEQTDCPSAVAEMALAHSI